MVAIVAEGWPGSIALERGPAGKPNELSALVADHLGQRVGVLSYTCRGTTVEVVTLTGSGHLLNVEEALLDALTGSFCPPGTLRLRTVVTNDDLRHLWLFQHAGFRLIALRPRALERRRRLEPAIPRVGVSGIPVRDELELLRVL